MSEEDLQKRVDDLEKFMTTSFPDYISGIQTSQKILFDRLIKHGLLKREEIGFIFDHVISEMSSKLPDRKIVINYLKTVRDDINRADPYQFPDTTRGLFGDEDPHKKQ